MEKLVLEDITTHLSETNITSREHGFQVGSSCATQLLECFDDWLTNLDMNLGTYIIVYLDFTKAFDCISHTHLLHKPRHCGIKGKLMNALAYSIPAGSKTKSCMPANLLELGAHCIKSTTRSATLANTVFALHKRVVITTEINSEVIR